MFVDFIEFKYIGHPNRLNCSLILRDDSYSIFLVGFLTSSIGLNVVFVVTYFVLHFYITSMLSVTPQMETLKKGALVITSMAAISYFIGYTPNTVVYIIFCINPMLLNNLPLPYNMIIDSVLTFMPHLNSCLLPLFLVTGTTMTRLKIAATITRNSYIMRKVVPERSFRDNNNDSTKRNVISESIGEEEI